MINFMELGTTTFEEGIAGGMDPGAAAQAAGQACMDAATDAGFPPDMCQACLDAGTQAFDDAMANGMPLKTVWHKRCKVECKLGKIILMVQICQILML